jgi:hypothetical protein
VHACTGILFSASVIYRLVDFIAFMRRCYVRLGNILQQLVSYAASSGRWKVKIAFKFSVDAFYSSNSRHAHIFTVLYHVIE